RAALILQKATGSLLYVNPTAISSASATTLRALMHFRNVSSERITVALAERGPHWVETIRAARYMMSATQLMTLRRCQTGIRCCLVTRKNNCSNVISSFVMPLTLTRAPRDQAEL